jgi:maleylacetate reductase
MRDFDQPGPPRVVFAGGGESRAASLLVQLGAARVLLVATSRHRDGADRIAAALGARSAGVWVDAQPQVPRATASAIVAQVRDTNADWVLAHGGGTAIGAAKAAALETDVRIAVVPTTYSGSEMTPIWGITDDGEKTTGRDARVQPQLVVYDPELLAPLRGEIRRTSLCNALAHSVDALLDTDAPPDVHDDAERSVRALLTGLRGLEADAHDRDALDEAVYGAHLAGKVLGRAQMALQHKLAHTLGGSFGTEHGPTHAVLLPYTMAYNLGEAPEARRRLQRAMDHADPPAALYDLYTRYGIPTRLTAVGFVGDDIDRAVELSMRTPYRNPRPLTEPGLRALLSDAVLGRRPTTAASTPSDRPLDDDHARR